MPGGERLQYPFPYKNTSGEAGDEGDLELDNLLINHNLTVLGNTTLGDTSVNNLFVNGYLSIDGEQFAFSKGSYTPTVHIDGSTITYHTQTGSYSRSGNSVTVSFLVNYDFTSTDGTNVPVRISLPFAPLEGTSMLSLYLNIIAGSSQPFYASYPADVTPGFAIFNGSLNQILVESGQTGQQVGGTFTYLTT